MVDRSRTFSLFEAPPAAGEDDVTLRTPVPSKSDSGEGSRQLLCERYEILGLVGVGGMGSVYRARDRELDEVVALKMLRRELVELPGMLERFRREAKLARRVTHRNVARVFDIGEHEGERFLTMELVDGEALSSVITREGRLAIPRALDIATGVCAGLAGAHAAGVVHRDLKPDNVLLAKDGRVVITDFGIARAPLDLGLAQTVAGPVGTPAYMAPEQVEGRRDVDARVDIYAFGELLYEMFTGKRPWSGETPFAMAAARLSAPPPDPRRRRSELPVSLAELALRCMARRPEDRFQTIEQVAAELEAIGVPVIVPVDESRQSVSPPPPMTPPSHGPDDVHTIVNDKTVAVLPFRNAGSPEDEHLAEELTDDLIDSLSMTQGLKIRSRGAVLKWKGLDRDAREVGRELGVQVVVEGSVRRMGGNVRISARLTSVADGFQLWAKRFDRPERDVLSINDDAAAAIAEALTVDSPARVRDAPTDPAAVDLYLRARYEYRRFRMDGQEHTIELFEEAEAHAPHDPMILSGKAMAVERRAFFTGEGIKDALALARRAAAVAPMLAEARLALGMTLFATGDWGGAVREFRQAVSRGPGLAEAHGALGRLLTEVGAFTEAIRFLETALALDPQAPLVMRSLLQCYVLLGDLRQVDALLDRSGASVPDLAAESRFVVWRRDRAAARGLLEKSRLLGEQALPITKAMEIIVEGVLPEKLEIFPSGVEEGNVRRRVFLLQVEAEFALLFGDNERAMSALERSAEGGLIGLGWLDRCPLFDGVRTDPRFVKVRAQVAERAGEILKVYSAT